MAAVYDNLVHRKIRNIKKIIESSLSQNIVLRLKYEIIKYIDFIIIFELIILLL